MTYLVTGGFGFLGGRMAHYLHEAGHRVVLGSRSARPHPAWLPRAEVRKTVWDDDVSLSDACRETDVVIHAAGMDAADCAADPGGAFEMNRLGTARLVRAACRNRVKMFVFLSTAHVYSAPLEGVVTEDSIPRNPHPYAASNSAGEKEVIQGTKNREMRGIVVRLSNGFGVPASDETKCGRLAINDLCRQAVETRKMVLKTSGAQRRDFISISGAVEAIHRLTGLPEPVPSGSVFNLGGGWAPTIWEVAVTVQERCHRIFGFSPEIERPCQVVQDVSPALDFRSDALLRAGIAVPRRQEEEIDRLLEYYQMSALSRS
ncbi:MAG: SDR family oxidoreductase [Terrimicrobiaceae bacterium]